MRVYQNSLNLKKFPKKSLISELKNLAILLKFWGKKFDFIIFDLGVSSYPLNNMSRGSLLNQRKFKYVYGA